jgi:murein L,D-transpeptidase YcbB/YkuD
LAAFHAVNPPADRMLTPEWIVSFMRHRFAATSFALAIAFSTGLASAQQPGPTATGPVASNEPSSQPALPSDPLEAAIAQRVAALKSRGAGVDRSHADQIAALYGERAMKPIWVATSKGVLAHAELVLAELSKAGDWGLDVKALNLPETPSAGATPEALAATEMRITLAVLTYARHARGGRVDPSQLSQWLDQKPRSVDVKDLLWSLAAASDPAVTLRKLHPRHAGFEALRQAYLSIRGAKTEPAAETPVTIPPGPSIKPGERHEHVALVRKRLQIAASAGNEERYDETLEKAVRAFMDDATGKRLGIIGKEVRAALNTSASRKPKETNAATARRLLVNMERWRWLPDDLGKTHVWNNLPEFETRFVKAGTVIHQERIIVGKPDTQTPVFSDRIRYVVFRPEWGLPPSLKVKDLLPKLQSGDYDVLDRRNMRISLKGKMSDPGSYDWSTVDIRKIPIVQEPGDDNPLGHMKFMFPNKHDVYMHDTPSKKLFDNATRMFSSGCIRVRNPRKFADLLFAEGGGLDASDVQKHASSSGEDNNKIDLERSIPVHNVYFTVAVDDNGKLRALADIYGHDARIAAVLLDGKSVAEVAATDPALKLKEKIDELATSGRLNEDAPAPLRRTSERSRVGANEPSRSSGYYRPYQPSSAYRTSGPRYYYQQRPPKSFFEQVFGN